MTLPRRLSDLAGLNAAAFIRVSTDQQQLSPPAQRDIIENFATEHGLTIVLTKELTISGRDAWRDPAVVEITEAVERGRIRAVIVSTLDRMGRSPRTDIFIEDIEQANAVLIDASNELISGNPAHRRAMRLGIATAGNERELIRDRVTAGIANRFEQYLDPWGHPPYGFRRTGDEPSLLTIDPETMPNAVALFERYASGTVSFDQLAEDAPLGREGLADLLANRLFNGWVRRYGEWRAAPWRQNPPINDTLWERVQAVRATRSRSGGARSTKRHHLFDGLLACAGCGRRLRLDGFGGTGRPYQRIRHVAPCIDWGRAERKALATWQDPLIAQVSNLEYGPEVIADVVAHLNAEVPTPTRPSLRQQQDIAQQLVAGTISGQQAEDRLQALRAAPTTPAPRRAVTSAQIRAALENMHSTWMLAEPEVRAQLTHAIYAQIPIYSDGRFGEIELTADATAKGLPRALPVQVTATYTVERAREG